MSAPQHDDAPWTGRHHAGRPAKAAARLIDETVRTACDAGAPIGPGVQFPDAGVR